MPVGLLDVILQFRAFKAAKDRYDREDDKNKLPEDDALLQLVKEIDFERAGERIRARRKQHGG